MSTDAAVTRDLIATIEDGKEGFAKGAEKLADSDRPELAATFRELSEQRAQFAIELQSMAQAYGDDIRESGSLAGVLHRGWMSLKDALAGTDPEGVLDVAEQGEDHAVSEYEKALAQDISGDLRTVVERQFTEVRAAHNRVRSLRSAHG
jgi:uncharacterized protein (TIGR02284 family)